MLGILLFMFCNLIFQEGNQFLGLSTFRRHTDKTEGKPACEPLGLGSSRVSLEGLAGQMFRPDHTAQAQTLEQVLDPTGASPSLQIRN